MNPIHMLGFRNATPPAAIIDNAAAIANVIDTAEGKGALYLGFLISLGASDAAVASIVLSESDFKTDDTTLDAGIEVADWADTKALPAATDDDKQYLVLVDLRKARSRFQQLVVTAGNGASGTFVSVAAFFVAPGQTLPNVGCADHLVV